eukprot:CAMPEP_0174824836 /NCGR_PEP_ID=MMETSP1107-20130205/38515_1 /TAXON_ID=36770 /ORGANISM="Paraphysomonas vestita, Strain GFlagA" /LENGTH=37 /DNA_ID= /DNA_START= /DNA_END= /DNA_ORIENTATION=
MDNMVIDIDLMETLRDQEVKFLTTFCMFDKKQHVHKD